MSVTVAARAAVAAALILTVVAGAPAHAATPQVGGFAPDKPFACTGTLNQVSVPYPLSSPPPSFGTLDSVAVAGRHDVWFSGYRNDPTVPGFGLEVWHYDGHRVVEVPVPRVGTWGDVQDTNFSHDKLSFSSPRSGWLVGSYMMNEEEAVDPDAATDPPFQPLVEHWDGHRWAVTPVSGGFPHAVLAVADDDAWIAGSAAGHALIEHWDGRQWRVVPHPGDALDASILYGLAASSADDVWAVGRYFDEGGVERTLTEHWDGRAWSVVASPNPADGGAAALLAVSADSPTDAWAVGEHDRTAATARSTTVLHWDGHAWRDETAELPDGGRGDAVVAFGPRDVYAATLSGVDHWDGTAWTAVPMVTDPALGTLVSGMAGSADGTLWVAGWANTIEPLGAGDPSYTGLENRAYRLCTRHRR